MSNYDPFARGPFTVGVRTVQARDAARDRLFNCEIWYPAPANHVSEEVPVPLVLYSHPSGGTRRSATFLCTHLCSHGYAVAALDHSETFVPGLARQENETPEQRASRVEASVTNRVPDLRFLLDYLLDGLASNCGVGLNSSCIGVVGHSFGGWTVLSAPEVERRIRAVVALAPGGSSNPRPGILRANLTFDWGRDVPVLYLVAENDTPLPVDGMRELFERTRSSKRMFILRRADHAHFMDNVEQEHERVRTMPAAGEWAYLQKEMLPIEDLCSAEKAHLFTRGLTLCHMDAVLKNSREADAFLNSDVPGALAARQVDGLEFAAPA